MKSQDIGLVCVASSPRHEGMLETFLNSFSLNEPNTPLIVFTKKLLDIKYQNPLIFNQVCPDLRGHWDDKIRILSHSEFHKTIYIDVDMIVLDKFVESIGQMLDDADLVVRSGMGFNIEWEKLVAPEHITQFNTGIFGIKREMIPPLTKQFWKYRQLPELSPTHLHDQIPFRPAVLSCKLRVRELSSDFNFMGGFECVLNKVRVVHFAGRHDLISSPNIFQICDRIRISPGGTTFFEWKPIYQNKHFTVLNVIKLVIYDCFSRFKSFLFPLYKQLFRRG